MEASLNAVHPYARLALTDRLAVWSALGFGTGELTLSEDGSHAYEGLSPRWRTGISMSMAALGAGGVLVTPEEADGFALSVKSDAYLMRMKSEAVSSSASGNLAETEVEASRLRLVLDGSRSFKLGPDSSLTPSFETGVRHDGGDGAAGTGVELGAAVHYAAPGLAVSARLGSIAGHDEGHDEWRTSVSARHDTSVPGLGFGVSLSPSREVNWGGTARPEHRIGLRVDLPLGPGGRAPHR